MSKFDTSDLVIRDVSAAADFFEHIVGLTPRFSDPNFTEMGSGALSILLTRVSIVPVRPTAGPEEMVIDFNRWTSPHFSI